MTNDEIINLAIENTIHGLKFDEEGLLRFAKLVAQHERSWEKFCDSHCVWTDHHPDCKLAKDEPVAWMREDGTLRFADKNIFYVGQPLYTTPPQRTWVGLTDEEIAEVEDEYIVDYRIPAGSAWNFAKDIEAKLKEKNT
jgi:hypothetical protein